jgi:transposase
MPAPHPPEFRQRAVELARQGIKPVAQIAKDLGISDPCLRNWMTQANADQNGSAVKLTSVEKRNWLNSAARPGSLKSRTFSELGH